MNDLPSTPVVIRPIEQGEIPTLLRLLNLAADFQNDDGAVVATENELAEGFLGDRPYVHGLFAEQSGRVVGVATYYFKYSTYRGRPILYLEDLYVDEIRRGQGIGRQLMRRLASIAVSHKCSSMEWITPSADTNSALRFYSRIGGTIVDKAQPFEVCTMRLETQSLEALIRG